MLKVCEPTQDPVALVLNRRLHDWQNTDEATVRTLLARLLDLCTQFIETILSLRFALPAPVSRDFDLLSVGRLNAEYLVMELDRREQLDTSCVLTIRCTATLEHRWQGEVDVRFPHPHGGWVRCVIPLAQLPDEAHEGDRVDVQFTERADGSIACHAIPGSWHAEPRRPTSQHEHLLPQPPGDWADAAAVERYVAALRGVYGERDAG